MRSSSKTPLYLIIVGFLIVQPTAAQLNPAASTALTSIEAFGFMTSQDNLGRAMAVGDFDNNGWNDLVLGAWVQIIDGEVPGGGGVAVLYGTSRGLDLTNVQSWNQNSPGIDDVVESSDGFGAALAVGDFDGDTYDDLAISAPFEDLELCLPVCVITEDYGVVHVFYGSSSGLTSTGSQVLVQTTGGLPGDLEAGDRLGWSLASGDFDIDGYDDLAIGVPFESLETPTTIECGAINLVYGSSSGLDTGRSFFWHQDTTGLDDVATSGDQWGEVLEVGNFRGLVDPDKPIDLVIGSPKDDQGPGAPSDEVRKGSVQILLGSVLGLLNTNDIYLTLDMAEIPGVTERDANFGSGLAVGDFDGNGFDDLAIGARNKDAAGIEDAGLVYVIESAGASGLDLTAVEFWGQDIVTVLDEAEIGDRFGEEVAADDLNGDGFDDLIVGVACEDEGPSALAGSGAVHVFNGSATGITATDNQLFHQGQLGETRESRDRFGYEIVTGRFSDSGRSLVIASPFEELRIAPITFPGPGIVHVINQAIFADGFESGTVMQWSSSVP